MKKFSFKFEKLQEVRKRKEDDALRALAAAQAALQAEVDQKNFYLGEIDKAQSRKQSFVDQSVPVSQLASEQVYIEGTKQRIVATERAILRANRTVEKAMLAFIQARRQRRILDALRDKQMAAFKEALKKREAKIQDDLTTMRFRLKDEELAVEEGRA